MIKKTGLNLNKIKRFGDCRGAMKGKIMPKKQAKTSRKVSYAGARQKGLNFEREICRRFKEIGKILTRRKLEFQIDAAIGVDLEGTGPLRVQCKNFQKYAPLSMITEVKDPTGWPCLITKGNNLAPIACLYLDHFLIIFEGYMRSLPVELQKEYGWEDPLKTDLGF